MPRGLANKRVNYDESISNITYIVSSNYANDINIRFKSRVLDAQTQTKNDIKHVHEQDCIIKPYSEIVINCPDLKVEKEEFNVLERERGPVILRATAVALEVSKNGDFPKGYKFDKVDFKFWVNMDSGRGIFDDYKDWEGGPEEPKSKIQPEGNGYVCYLNITHPAYEIIKENGDESDLLNYAQEQLLRQTMILLLKTDKTEYWPDISGKNYKANIQGADIEKSDLIDSCLATIDYLFAEFLK